MKNYLVIGGSSGIGESLVASLAAMDYNVYATYNNTQPKEIAGVQYQALNVMDLAFNSDWLPDSIDGLVYCPGSINLMPFSRIKPNDYVEDFKLQVVGAIQIIQQLLPNLKASKSASIILFSTVAAQLGFNYHTQVATSKGAIEGLTKSLAAELSPQIRVNAIAPSLTNTALANNLLNTEQKIEANAKRHPMQRIGQPGDIAEIAAFLLNDKSSWITGQIIHVDGGISTIKK